MLFASIEKAYGIIQSKRLADQKWFTESRSNRGAIESVPGRDLLQKFGPAYEGLLITKVALVRMVELRSIGLNGLDFLIVTLRDVHHEGRLEVKPAGIIDHLIGTMGLLVGFNLF